jgi:aminopeptidase YwaD
LKAKWITLAGTLCLVCAAGILLGQEKEDRTLLAQRQMTAIINEVSGERAMHHVLELVPYHLSARPPSIKVTFAKRR